MYRVLDRPLNRTGPTPLPEVDDATRREFLIGAAGLLALAPYGCGVEPGEGGKNGSGGTRTVRHAFGEVELPANPQRMVATWTAALDYALVLDIPLVGGTGSIGYAQAPFPEYQQERYPEKLEGIEKVQVTPEINFEQVAALNPDCILTNDIATEDIYARLSGIAPTFAYPYYREAEVDGATVGRVDWKGSLRAIAEAFGRRRQAQGFLNGYRARVQDLRPRLAERWSGATFAAVSPEGAALSVPGSADRLEGPVLFGDLGLAPAPFVTPNSQELSLEQIPRLEDADVLLVGVFPRAAGGSLEVDREALAPSLGSGLWRELPAVRNDQAFEYAYEIAYASPLTADAWLDYAERTLLGRAAVRRRPDGGSIGKGMASRER